MNRGMAMPRHKRAEIVKYEHLHLLPYNSKNYDLNIGVFFVMCELSFTSSQGIVAGMTYNCNGILVV